MAQLTYLAAILNEGPKVPGGQDGQDTAYEFFSRMIHHPDQGRSPCWWNEKLASIARLRVMSMAKDGWLGHVDPDNHGPNWYVAQNGYKLPGYYLDEPDLNYIESLNYGGGPNVDAEKVWSEWMNSPHHKTHILGLDPFYAAQTQVGIASYFLQDSKAGVYHCILTAPPEPV